MNNILKINFRKRKRLTSLLGLTVDGSRLEGVVLRRSNGSLQRQQSFSVELTLDPLTAAPELVGREIRNHLDSVGVRERHCVVGLPSKWALTAHTELPPLSEADAASLLQLEAERGFPCDVTTLQLANSRCPLSGGKQHATLVGIPSAHVTLLEQVLRAAKLKPVSFSLGITALQPPAEETSNGVLTLVIGERHVGLQITCGGGVAALRALEITIETEGARHALPTDLVARETRITLGQLPAELREAVLRVRIFGPGDLARQLADEMELRFEPMGLEVEVVSAYTANEFGSQLPPEAPVSPAFSLAARQLMEQSPAFEFLPPKPTAWEQITARYSSGKLQTIGAVAAGILVIVGGLFLFQQWQLSRLQSQWSKMSAKVKDLDSLQQQIQQYRPWFDESFRALSALRQLTMAFPEDGVVSAKTVEIREGETVTCTGVARDNASLLRTLSQLRAANGVNDVKLEQIRGKSPMQFSFDFHWGNGGGNEN
ncbi:MAG TPA: hypothetical protein VKA67_10200 [Verrucomicrobiae bacterium]|nr:hypothetical protein [Verrucomicrobiae bacterium]